MRQLYYRWKGRLRGWWLLPNGVILEGQPYPLSWRGRLYMKLLNWADRKVVEDARREAVK